MFEYRTNDKKRKIPSIIMYKKTLRLEAKGEHFYSTN